MSIWLNCKRLYRSKFYSKSKLKSGSVFYGTATMFTDTEFEPGSEEWKRSFYSFKLVVDRIENNRLYYYSIYVDEQANENIRNYTKYIDVDVFVKQVRELKLLVE